MSKKSNRFSPEVREPAVRLVQDHGGEYPSLWAAIESIAPKIGCVPQTLHEWARKQEVDTGLREGITSEERDRIKALERENKELRRANEILKLASAFFCPGGAGPPAQVLRGFVDKHRDTHGVEPICEVLQIAPSGYRRHAACQRKPELRCARAKRDDTLMPQIQQVWQANMQVYGADKVWHQMNREGVTVARCTVERLMKRLNQHGVRRGKVVRTTVPDKAQPCPLDRVNRQFKADRPNQLWVSDFTYVSTWQGWQYVSILYTERLAEAGIEPSVGSRGDSYDNALAETINGLYKAELIHRRAPVENEGVTGTGHP